MDRLTRRTARVVVLGMLVGVAGCTGDEEPRPASEPVFTATACPDDVEVHLVPEHSCGYVDPGTGSRRIFVVIVEPPTPSGLSPVLETGTDLGMTPAYGGLAPIAQRTGRRTVIVDLPGTGHSSPSLECPEVAVLGDRGAERHHERLVRAVARCRDRLLAAGTDPAAFTPAGLSADLYAVMTALDEPRWVVMGHGTTAEAGRQVALEHPDRVEALVMDSPVMEGRSALADTRRVVAAVARACRADPACRTAHGDPAQSWTRARHRLSRTPLRVEVAGTSVVVDAGMLARAVRWLVAPASLGARQLPALLTEAAAARPGTLLGQFAASITAAPPLCVGYLPKCESDRPLAFGAVLSALCPELAVHTAWTDVCRAWGVARHAGLIQPLRRTPTLVLFGTFNPYVSPREVRTQVAERVPHAYLVEHASGGHNVLAFPGPVSVRNAWLAGDVHRPPPAVAALTDPPDFTP